MEGPGFALVAGEGGVALSRIGEPSSAAARLLTIADHEDASVALLGRIHYAGEAGLPPDPGLSEAGRVLAAFRKRGQQALESLEGEFSLVILDRRQRRILALRDPLGCYPCYWAAAGCTFAVASSIRPLLAAGIGVALDPEALGDYLMRPVLALQETATEATLYRGIQRVVPGTILTHSLATGATTRNRYWSWRERIIEPVSDRTDDVGDQAGALLRAAVRERLAPVTGAHFSGGMDSTAVALLARDGLAGSPGSQLHTLSLVYDQLGSMKGEAGYVRDALAGQSGLTPHLVIGDDLLAYDGFGQARGLAEPYPGILSLAQDKALIDVAAAAGCAAVLTGEGGDDALDVMPYHIAALLGRGRVLAAWQGATSWARGINTDPWPIFRRYGVGPLVPLNLRGGLRAMVRGGLVDWRGQGEATVAPWIRPEFARRHDLRGRGLRHLEWYWRADADAALSAMLAAIQCRVGDARRQSLAAPAGMTLSHPFLDARLLRLALGIRRRYQQDARQQKPLLARAMREVLPESIRTRRAKGHFNEVYFKGLARNRPMIEDIIRVAPIDDLGLIDKPALISALRKTALGVEVSGFGMMRLDLTLSLLHWLACEQASSSSTATVTGQIVDHSGNAH